MSRGLKLLSLALLVTLAACGKDDDGGRPPLGGALEGSWVTVGYGYTVRFEGDEVDLYELTAVSCLPLADGDVEEDGTAPDLALRFTREGEALVIENGQTFHVTAQRAPLPEVCTGTKPPKKDPR
ncbi:hypothetical protein [Pyxidicoccus caerfyrddinensis]|uniref:hypothetical protein n=1 Tax=Pyxidicoccus caerfyrddinensis TaxID=2709663 RepID=UPI0013D9AFF7|nr:hypothetical protein [Pyxidicoccus caerfyrddinensis]